MQIDKAESSRPDVTHFAGGRERAWMRFALVTVGSRFCCYRPLLEEGATDGEPAAEIESRPRGNPAVLGMNPLDRKLCVLAFRRVCPWNGLIVRFLAGISQAVWSLSADT